MLDKVLKILNVYTLNPKISISTLAFFFIWLFRKRKKRKKKYWYVMLGNYYAILWHFTCNTHTYMIYDMWYIWPPTKWSASWCEAHAWVGVKIRRRMITWNKQNKSLQIKWTRVMEKQILQHSDKFIFFPFPFFWPIFPFPFTFFLFALSHFYFRIHPFAFGLCFLWIIHQPIIRTTAWIFCLICYIHYYTHTYTQAHISPFYHPFTYVSIIIF